MEKIFTLKYYFDTSPGSDFKYWIALLIFAGILLILSTAIKTYRQKIKDKILRKMIKSYPSQLFWFAVVAAFLVWIRLENVKLLSMRFFWIIYFALMFYLIVKNIKTFYREYPRKVRQSLSHQEQNKYLPTQKKKKK